VKPSRSSSEGDRVSRDAVALRVATQADYLFLRNLYASTREEEMKQFPFDELRKKEFLDQQFAAQYQHYQLHYPTCERNIIEIDGKPAGRLWIDEWKDQIRLVDIALMPDWRGSGVGSTLVREVLERGRSAGKPVTIHVEAYNPALRMYERMGFARVDTNGVYFLMKWTP
jgi:ribosomal protein S18 acetylase RimI-like enzyme